MSSQHWASVGHPKRSAVFPAITVTRARCSGQAHFVAVPQRLHLPSALVSSTRATRDGTDLSERGSPNTSPSSIRNWLHSLFELFNLVFITELNTSTGHATNSPYKYLSGMNKIKKEKGKGRERGRGGGAGDLAQWHSARPSRSRS